MEEEEEVVVVEMEMEMEMEVVAEATKITRKCSQNNALYDIVCCDDSDSR